MLFRSCVVRKVARSVGSVRSVSTSAIGTGDVMVDAVVYEKQLRREQAAIEAIQALPWWRRGILLRRPWRSSMARSGQSLLSWVCAWLFVIHDCADPAVACSCSGGFRFPRAS